VKDILEGESQGVFEKEKEEVKWGKGTRGRVGSERNPQEQVRTPQSGIALLQAFHPEVLEGLKQVTVGARDDLRRMKKTLVQKSHDEQQQ
jgi:hypothetical protein